MQAWKLGENNMKRKKKNQHMLQDTIPLPITIVMSNPKSKLYVP